MLCLVSSGHVKLGMLGQVRSLYFRIFLILHVMSGF
jgi:hypothetical protein